MAQKQSFYKNIAIAGGLLAYAAFGAGAPATPAAAALLMRKLFVPSPLPVTPSPVRLRSVSG